MTHFEDGPAKGQTLMLKRAPLFLRVVAKKQDKVIDLYERWDALDQLDDVPDSDEKIFAYARQGKPGMVHISTGRKNHGGFFPMASYKFIKEQPADAVMRDRESWRKWCEEMRAESEATKS